MKIVFMGSPDYGVKILDALNRNFEVVAVYTQPDKPVGRKKVLTPTPVKSYALKHNLEVFAPSTLKDENIKRFNADFIVVAAYGLLLPKEIVKENRCINLHASLLPKYRGASPIQSAILNGDEYTGVTSMLMDEGFDTGDILVWDYTEVGNKDSIMLFNELADIAAKQIVYTIKNFEQISPLIQIDALSSYAKKIKKEDGFIDFEDALIIDRKFRAFKPWPGIFCDKFKLVDIEVVDFDSVNNKGEILSIEEDGFIVGCSKGRVKIKELQVPGKQKVKALDYLNGKRLKKGDFI